MPSLTEVDSQPETEGAFVFGIGSKRKFEDNSRLSESRTSEIPAAPQFFQYPGDGEGEVRYRDVEGSVVQVDPSIEHDMAVDEFADALNEPNQISVESIPAIPDESQQDSSAVHPAVAKRLKAWEIHSMQGHCLFNLGCLPCVQTRRVRKHARKGDTMVDRKVSISRASPQSHESNGLAENSRKLKEGMNTLTWSVVPVHIIRTSRM